MDDRRRFRSHPLRTPQQTDLPSQQQEWMPPANWSGVQPDQVQIGETRHALRHQLRSRTNTDWDPGRPIVPQMRFSPKTTKIVTANVWQLIMNQNERRIDYIVSNPSASTVQMSFGRPIANVGIPIPSGQTKQGAGFSCPIDEVWILSTVANVFIVGYEGIATTKDYGPKHGAGGGLT